jgi:hypothetical protein
MLCMGKKLCWQEEQAEMKINETKAQLVSGVESSTLCVNRARLPVSS